MTAVLLVDDDVELAEMLGDYLVQDGFLVTAVHDGLSGVEEALSGRHAIVVLDVMMPGLSGVEALRRIRAASALPVLMLTAKGDDMDRIVGLELGADDYVPSPASRASWRPVCGPSCAARHRLPSRAVPALWSANWPFIRPSAGPSGRGSMSG